MSIDGELKIKLLKYTNLTIQLVVSFSKKLYFCIRSLHNI